VAGWRILAAAALLLLIGVPLAALLPLALSPVAWPDAEGLDRMTALARNTAWLVALVLLFTVPLGAALALLLERTDLPGRAALTLALVVPLFVPLPIFASGWEAAVGPGGLWPLMHHLTGLTGWAPWAQGLGPAAFLHAVAGLPWVVLICGAGARAVERGLEDDARLLIPPAAVIARVTLPRMGASALAAALVVALQAAGEVTITDLAQVRTYAEEVYTQLVGPEPGAGRGDPVGRALVGALGQVLLTVGLVLLLARRVERLAPAGAVQAPAAAFPLGAWRWPAFATALLLTAALLLVPTAGLVWRAGASGAPLSWSPVTLVEQLARTARSDEGAILRQVGVCALSGAACAALALVLSWLLRGSGWLAALVAVLVALAWAVPGPVLGLGLKGALRTALDLAGWPSALAVALWYGPSSLPLVWVYLFRYLPVAMALVWPVVRLVPRELIESARLEGAGAGRQLVWLAGPYARAATLRAALAVTVLSLGELSAGKLVSTPGAESYAEVVWAQMHYGLSGDLAARCLLLLAVVLAGAALLWPLSRQR
jgi:iron(III) transport system permease protein